MMRSPVIIKSTNAFSSIIEMKLCSNLKETMYFLILVFCLHQNKGGGRGEGGNGTCITSTVKGVNVSCSRTQQGGDRF